VQGIQNEHNRRFPLGTDARSLGTDKYSLGTDARSLGTDKYSLGTASKTKQCPHCSGKSHGSLGAAGCTEGRAWLKTKAGRKFTENKAKKKAAKKAKLDESQATLHAFKKK
jgi:hypothetical protein